MCTIYVAKTKALISCAVMFCALVFAFAKSRFSHETAHLEAHNHITGDTLLYRVMSYFFCFKRTGTV